MNRFFLPPEQCQGSELRLVDAEAHHAAHVARIRPGERAIVLDGQGGEFLCEVAEIGKRDVVLAVRQKHAVPPLPYQLTLVQAVTKGKTMDVIVQKATELGVHRIVPILSERTVAHLEEDTAVTKVQKWQVTAIEALKQCGSAWLPKIDFPLTPKAFLARAERFDLSLIATLQPGAQHPRELFHAYAAEQQRRPGTLALWVGPEGDFTPAEISAVRGAGALPITLGQLILRSETAAIYCLAVSNYELQAPA